jgi:putative membrane protein
MTRTAAAATDLVVGVAAGVAAAFAMNLFQLAWSKAVSKPPEPSATQDAAYHLSGTLTGHVASPTGRKILGNVIHYTTGAVLGGVYGLISGVFPTLTFGKGTAFGTAVWATADEIAVPLVGLGPPLGRTDAVDHAYGLASHLIFGLTLDFVRRHLNARISAPR